MQAASQAELPFAGDAAPIVFIVDGDFTTFTSGSHSRFHDAITFLLANGHPVTVYACRNHPTAPWTAESEARFASLYRTAALVLESQTGLDRISKRLRSAFAVVFPGRAGRILGWPGLRPSPYLRQASRAGALFFVNFVDLLFTFGGLETHRVIIDTQDIDFVKRSRRPGRDIVSLAVLAKARQELGALRACAEIVAISAAERAILSVLLDRSVLLIPTFRSGGRAVTANRQPDYDYDLLFLGSDYEFNPRGLISFLEESSAWSGGLRIGVAGSVCRAPGVREAAARHGGVSLLGYVDNLDTVFERSKLLISPVTGTGLKIKILDALERGTPVLASRESMEGLPDGYEGAVFPLTEETALRLVANAELLATAQGRALDYSAALTAAPDRAKLLQFVRSRMGSQVPSPRHQ